LFLGLFTCLLTGQTFSTSSADGFGSAAGAPSTSPNHVGQSSSSRITGIRPWRSAINALAFGTMVDALSTARLAV
jgi:hypothetical protein